MEDIAPIINSILNSDDVNIAFLRRISRLPDGFIANEIRTRVWPKICSIDRYKFENYRSFVIPHKDDKQIECDIERSLWNYECNQSWESDYRDERRLELTNIIMAILCKHPQLNYFQGFHDIAAVFLQVLKDDGLTFAITENVCMKYFPDCMLPDFKVTALSMEQLNNIIRVGDIELFEHLHAADVEPFFAFSWVITWFAHDLKHFETVTRVFDIMLCSPPCYSLYLAAAVVIYHRDIILSTECEFSTLHNLLVHLPISHEFNVEQLALIADTLLDRIPTSSLISIGDNKLKELLQAVKIALLSDEFNTTTAQPDWKLIESSKTVSADSNTTPAMTAPLDASNPDVCGCPLQDRGIESNFHQGDTNEKHDDTCDEEDGEDDDAGFVKITKGMCAPTPAPTLEVNHEVNTEAPMESFNLAVNTPQLIQNDALLQSMLKLEAQYQQMLDDSPHVQRLRVRCSSDWLKTYKPLELKSRNIKPLEQDANNNNNSNNTASTGDASPASYLPTWVRYYGQRARDIITQRPGMVLAVVAVVGAVVVSKWMAIRNAEE